MLQIDTKLGKKMTMQVQNMMWEERIEFICDMWAIEHISWFDCNSLFYPAQSCSGLKEFI